MGDLIPFRKRPKPPRTPKSWTKPEDYGHVLSASQWRGEPARPNILIRFWRAIRWWLGIVVIAALWVLYRNAIAYDPPAFLEGQPVAVNGQFTRCGAGRGPLCVVDGDTLKLDQRTMRIVGIDAPEVRAQCPAEALGAERATAVLQRWVNAAPFDLVPRLDRPTDKYGRELMTARRTVRGPSGVARTETAAEVLIEAGVARAYLGDARAGWC
ncbi:MAG: hypothetical protein ABIT16_08240 [Croceibacterium sp.]